MLYDFNENRNLSTYVSKTPNIKCHKRPFRDFYVLLTVHLSIFISVINQLDAQNFCFTISLFHASTCFEDHVLKTRRSKLYYAASGIITPIGGRPMHRLREDSLNLCTGWHQVGSLLR